MAAWPCAVGGGAGEAHRRRGERSPVAAVRDDRYQLAASLAAGARGIVLESDAITARLIVQSARRPGLSLVYRDLLDFAGDELHLTFDPDLISRTLGDTLLALATSSVIGVLRDGRPLLVWPPSPLPPRSALAVRPRRFTGTARHAYRDRGAPSTEPSPARLAGRTRRSIPAGADDVTATPLAADGPELRIHARGADRGPKDPTASGHRGLEGPHSTRAVAVGYKQMHSPR
ncbi:hypothetical protein ACF05L_22315 [Streptomyces bobili]|uniref:CASTOR/POLLUX-related putative ion channel n=1 Tax=Streptomyces bobili TaxID=67280 RepID=UPI0036FC7DC7